MNEKFKQNKIRYNLHRKIRKEGYKLDTRKRTIYIYFKNLDFSESALILCKDFKYSIQTSIEE